MDLKDLIQAFAGLSEAKRPIRLRLSQGKQVLGDVLLVNALQEMKRYAADLNTGFYAYRQVLIYL